MPDSSRQIKLVINADDLGFSKAVNRGIVQAHKFGPLKSASLMVNGLAYADALTVAAECPGLGIGIHCNLTEFEPVSPPDQIASLVDAGGCFFSRKEFMARAAAGNIQKEHIHRELKAQIQKVADAGIFPTHLDTHQHIHVLPAVFEVMTELAPDFGIGYIRTTREALPPWYRVLGRETLKRLYFGRHTPSYRRKLAKAGLKTNDAFWGLDRAVGRKPLEVFLRIVLGLEAGLHELMCHPGQVDQDPVVMDDYAERRVKELEALTHSGLMQAIAERNIRLQHFGLLDKE